MITLSLTNCCRTCRSCHNSFFHRERVIGQSLAVMGVTQSLHTGKPSNHLEKLPAKWVSTAPRLLATVPAPSTALANSPRAAQTIPTSSSRSGAFMCSWRTPGAIWRPLCLHSAPLHSDSVQFLCQALPYFLCQRG